MTKRNRGLPLRAAPQGGFALAPTHGYSDKGFLRNRPMEPCLIQLLDDEILNEGILDEGILDEGILNNGILNNGILDDGIMDDGILYD